MRLAREVGGWEKRERENGGQRDGRMARRRRVSVSRRRAQSRSFTNERNLSLLLRVFLRKYFSELGGGGGFDREAARGVGGCTRKERLSSLQEERYERVEEQKKGVFWKGGKKGKSDDKFNELTKTKTTTTNP